MFYFSGTIDMNVAQKHPIIDSAVASLLKVSLLAINVNRHANLEHAGGQGARDIDVARTIVPVSIDV